MNIDDAALRLAEGPRAAMGRDSIAPGRKARPPRSDGEGPLAQVTAATIATADEGAVVGGVKVVIVLPRPRIPMCSRPMST